MSAVTRVLLLTDQHSRFVAEVEELLSTQQCSVVSRVLPAALSTASLPHLDQLIVEAQPSFVLLVYGETAGTVRLSSRIRAEHGVPVLCLDTRRIADILRSRIEGMLGQHTGRAGDQAVESDHFPDREVGDVIREMKRLKTFNENIVEGIAEAILVESSDGLITFANPAAAELLEYPRSEIIGRQLNEILKETSDETSADDHPTSSRPLSGRYEATVISRKGRHVPVLVSARPLVESSSELSPGDAESEGADRLLALTDITHNKRAERALLRLSTAVKTTADSVIICDPEGFIVDANEATLELCGRESKFDLYGRSFFDLIASEDRERAAMDALRLVSEGAVTGREYELVSPQGDRIPVEMSLSLMSLADSKPVGFVVVSRDIAERKRAERALRESQERYRSLYQMLRLMADNVPDLIWAKDLAKRYLFANRAVCQRLLHAVDTDEPMGKTELFFAHRERLTHPEDRTWYTFGEIGMASDDIIMETEEPQRFDESGWVRGQYMALDVYKAPFWDQDGHMIGTVGCGRVVTEQRRLEKERERLLQVEHQQRVLAETLVEVAEALSGTLDQSVVLNDILDQLARVVDYDSAAVALRTGDVLDIVAQRGLPPCVLDDPHIDQNSRPHVDEVMRERRVVIIPNTETDERWEYRECTGYVRCWLGVPLAVRDRVIGILSLDKAERGFYNEHHARLALTFAQQAAIAYDNARLYAQARQDAATKESLLREVNHRVKNNLAAIIGLLYTEEQADVARNSAECRGLVERMVNRIQGLASVHSMLSASGWAPLQLDELVYQVTSSALQMLPVTKHVDVRITPSPVRVTSKQANDLALVINELTMNTMKHALADRTEARIEVSIEYRDDWITLRFRNDGPDYPPDALEISENSVGLNLIRTIVRYNLRGELTVHNDQGALVIVRFKDEID
jgi:PAS domain S-box-containing protein